MAACGGGTDQNLEPCGPNGECDPGFECNPADNLCYRSGAGDAGVDARSVDAPAGGPDAPGAPDARIDAAPGTPDAPIDAVPGTPDAPPDTTPPETTIVDKPADPSNDTAPTFSFMSEPGATFECRLSPAPSFTPCPNPVTLGPLGGGSHTFEVRAVDGAQNRDPSPAAYTWTIDLTGPTTTITSGPAAGSTVGRTFTFTYSSEPGASFECAIDAPPVFAACLSTGISYTLNASGPATFRVRARDALSNLGAETTRSFTVDATPPTITFTPLPGNESNTWGTIAFAPSEALTSIDCTVDDAPVPCDVDGYSFEGAAHGGHTLRVTATDAYDNTGGPYPYAWSVVRPPSCRGLYADECAPVNHDCCESLIVRGGTFNRFNNPAKPATVSTFHLDRYEASVGRFREFVASGTGTQANPPTVGAGAHPNIPGSGWQAAWNQFLPTDTNDLIAKIQCTAGFYTWVQNNPAANNFRPINCMSWYLAFAFCAWDGARLPTLAESQFAGAAGSQQRVRPWSVPPSSTTIDSSYATYGCQSPSCGSGNITGCGAKPPGNGLWGHQDLAGNLAEWLLDSYGSTANLPVPCVDCAYLTADLTFRKEFGGDFTEADTLIGNFADPFGFGTYDQANAYNARLGFRCARD